MQPVSAGSVSDKLVRVKLHWQLPWPTLVDAKREEPASFALPGPHWSA